MLKTKVKHVDIIIVLNELTAEGCPILALSLIEEWQKLGISIIVLRFQNKNDELIYDFLKRGIKIISLNLGDKGISRYFKIILKSYLICKKYTPFSILSFQIGWHSFIAIGAKLAGSNKIFAHAGNAAPEIKNLNFWKFFFLIQLGRPFTNKIICCSKYVEKSILKNFRLYKRETAVVFNCFNDSKFRLSEKFLLKEENKKKINVGMVGRLEIHKDQETLIRSIAILKTRKHKINLLLIGDGSKRKYLEKLSYKLNIKEEVNFLGAINNVNEKLDELDIFIFSTTPDEGFGIALVEAMVKKIPIIASDVGACREILLNGHCGFLVEPKSEKAIANQIEYILENKNETLEKVNNAFKHSTENFSKIKMSKNYLKFLM